MQPRCLLRGRAGEDLARRRRRSTWSHKSPTTMWLRRGRTTSASPMISITKRRGCGCLGTASWARRCLPSRRSRISSRLANYTGRRHAVRHHVCITSSPVTPNSTTSQDYAQRTVTIDPHPHLNEPHASVHPCKHSAVMKRIVENLIAGGSEPKIDQYIFIFLKFIGSVVPTIEYDYTMASATAGTGKG
mmetsp:Transcript_71985/g.204150  ORF Transcript_71985/g.204150 Transcript_71985/m.204150 type:complete len:189 (-) Transcript_71985:2600-3166(-)